MVSIVVPVYNVEKYLKECVDSILLQTYMDYELILVDDGSRDSSGTICDIYTQNSRVKVIHKENAGLGEARNSGIQVAEGEYITFLDADDYWARNALELLMDAIQRNHADTCVGGYTRITNEGKILLEELPEEQVYSTNSDVKEKLFPRLMGSSTTHKDAFRPSVWNAVYSMSIIRKNGIKFPSEREFIAEDIIFDIDYYKYSERVCIVSSSGYFYRVTPGSLTQRYNADRFEKIIHLYKEILNRLDEYDNRENCHIRAKRQFFVYVRSCLTQENPNVSGLDKENAILNIKSICSNQFVKECIKSYPVNKMGIPQRIFIHLIKWRCVNILYLLLCRQEKKGGKA